jgi:hypothetical protein
MLSVSRAPGHGAPENRRAGSEIETTNVSPLARRLVKLSGTEGPLAG